MTELDPNILHDQGLEASLAGRFSEAKDLFAEARRGFWDNDADLDVGRVDRDMARVFAGLGKPALRNAAIKSAYGIHWDAFRKDENNVTNAASELAATYHVEARIELATRVEGRHVRLDRMARKWKEAHILLRMINFNADYLQQVITHGALAITVFSPHVDLGIADKLIHDPEVKNMTDPKRVKAVDATGKLLTARSLYIPVHLVPKVREKVISAVAGPYLTNV